MKKISCIAALLLGLAFIVFGLNFWLQFLPSKGAPAPESFMGLLYGSGYLAVIKALEVIGGVLLILPRTRVLGLFLVGAILFNIACVHQFMFGGLKDPVVIFSALACLFLAYDAWKKSCGCGCCASCTCGCQSSGSTGSCCSTESNSGCCGEKK